MRPRSLIGSRFVADLGTLVTGAGAAQLITFAATPVVTRLFTPADFGAAAFFLSLLTIAAPVASLRYDQAIFLPREDRQASQLTWLAVALVGALCTSGWLAIALWDLLFAWPASVARLAGWIYALPLGVALMGAATIAGVRRTRDRDFAAVSRANVAASSTMVAARVGFGAGFGSSVGAMIAGQLFGQAMRLAMLVRGRTLRELDSSQRPTRAELAEVAREYRDFATRSAPTGLLNRFSAVLPVLMLTLFFGPVAAGMYALTERALRTPLAVLAEAVRNVFVQRSAVQANQGRSLARPYAILSLALVALSAPPLLLMGAYGGELFSMIFGERWAEAGPYLRALTPMLLTVLPMAPANVVLTVSRRLGWYLFFQLTLALCGTLAFLLADAAGWDAVAAVAAFSWVVLAVNGSIALAALLFSRRPLPIDGSVDPQQ